ncbi:hypothetical protein AVEN_135427-1 [Araneus ventricosus]|uniref:Uncharacterized protein n=1 Tax=Araneus ventricosus TaxID=182803 RepID=A0A4Y2BE78_ARAVE|nr:hypothetical protein AVEN_135427-1 [Araneus ventricosus]
MMELISCPRILLLKIVHDHLNLFLAVITTIHGTNSTSYAVALRQNSHKVPPEALGREVAKGVAPFPTQDILLDKLPPSSLTLLPAEKGDGTPSALGISGLGNIKWKSRPSLHHGRRLKFQEGHVGKLEENKKKKIDILAEVAAALQFQWTIHGEDKV